jgi:hypothetical protein
MVQVLGGNPEAVSKVKRGFLDLIVFDMRGKFALPYGPVPVGKLGAYDLFEGFIFIRYGPPDPQLRRWYEKGGEHGEAHDVIPVRMGYEDVSIYGALFEVVGHEPVAEGFYSRAEIYDHEFFIGPNFKARGIASVFYSGGSRTGDGAAVAPKSY